MYRYFYRFLCLIRLGAIVSLFPLYAEPGITIRDSLERRVTLEEPARRVVSLAPNITETIYALGYAHALVGVSEFCNYPEEVLELSAVGNPMNPNIELLLSMQPDIIIHSFPVSHDFFRRLESLALKGVLLEATESFDGIYDKIIRPIARILGDIDAGENLVRLMKRDVQKLHQRTSDMNRQPSLYYIVDFGENGDWTAGGNTFIGQMIEMVGARNVAEDLDGWSFSFELLLLRNPNIIIVPNWAIENFLNHPAYQELSAVRNGYVYPVNEDIFVRQGPRIIEGLKKLQSIVASYP